ncbi:MAG: hypothetical protein NC078_05815 [Ruminococcus sp.]|nr:hypothetical protein [Ruminococcus sp.]
MKFKLRADFTERIPLIIRRRNNVVYFQTQIEVAEDAGQQRRVYSEEYKTDEHNIKKVGTLAFELLKKLRETRIPKKMLSLQAEVI